MLVVEKNDISENFLEIFNKKFSNFCNKSPVLISFKATIDNVVINEMGSGKSKNFKFDHSLSIKQNIKIIKDWLVENTYPIMIQEIKEYNDYTQEEFDKLVSDLNITLEQASLMKKEKVSLIPHRIERVLIKKDEVFVTNLVSHRQFRYKLTIPITVLLKNLRGNWTPKYAFEIFQKKSKMLNEIYLNIEEEKSYD